MSWILKQLGGSLGPYIMVALGVIILGLLITTKMLWSSNSALRNDLAISKAAVESLTSANTSNQSAIRTLTDANNAWSAMFAAQKTKDEKAAQDQQRFREMLEASARATIDAVRRERQEPDCAAIMQIDIQRVCPATARRMRDDAAASTH